MKCPSGYNAERTFCFMLNISHFRKTGPVDIAEKTKADSMKLF